MLQRATKVQLALYCFAGAVQAQSAGSAARTTYGNNDLTIGLDNELVSRNYQDVDIQLLSPAFTNPESVPSGFSNGTSGPTPDHEMGKNFQRRQTLDMTLMIQKTISCDPSLSATTGPLTTALSSSQSKAVLFLICS